MDPMKRNNPMTLEALATTYPIIDWQQYLRHFIPGDVDVPEKVIVYAPSYLEQLAAWITQDDQVSDEALKDYFLLHLMFRWIAALDTETQKLLQKVYGKVKTGNSNLRSREEICVARTNIGFGHLVGRYFVMKSFGGDDKRAHFDDLVTNIHNTWIKSVTALEWLDESTRKEALDKVNHHKASCIMPLMIWHVVVGYAPSFPWIQHHIPRYSFTIIPTCPLSNIAWCHTWQQQRLLCKWTCNSALFARSTMGESGQAGWSKRLAYCISTYWQCFSNTSS